MRRFQYFFILPRTRTFASCGFAFGVEPRLPLLLSFCNPWPSYLGRCAAPGTTWRTGDLNSIPDACKAPALPGELVPLMCLLDTPAVTTQGLQTSLLRCAGGTLTLRGSSHCARVFQLGLPHTRLVNSYIWARRKSFDLPPKWT